MPLPPNTNQSPIYRDAPTSFKHLIFIHLSFVKPYTCSDCDALLITVPYLSGATLTINYFANVHAPGKKSMNVTVSAKKKIKKKKNRLESLWYDLVSVSFNGYFRSYQVLIPRQGLNSICLESDSRQFFWNSLIGTFTVVSGSIVQLFENVPHFYYYFILTMFCPWLLGLWHSNHNYYSLNMRALIWILTSLLLFF